MQNEPRRVRTFLTCHVIEAGVTFCQDYLSTVFSPTSVGYERCSTRLSPCGAFPVWRFGNPIKNGCLLLLLIHFHCSLLMKAENKQLPLCFLNFFILTLLVFLPLC